MTSPPSVSARRPGRHLVVLGPTASGKSALALALAQRRRARGEAVELICADSMQVYKGMDIGTATATAQEQSSVPHHLIDMVEPDQEFSVAEFNRAATAVLDRIEADGGDAIVVGGTALYLQALIDGFDVPGRFPQERQQLEADQDTAALFGRLQHLDPLAASRMEPTNRRRIIRALEVTIGSGVPFSSHGPGIGANDTTPFVVVGLRLDRTALRDRIEERYRTQLDDGFLDEVQVLLDRDDPLSRTASQALGYAEMIDHLRNGTDLEAAIESAVVRTRRFAVRQERWFRRDSRIEWFDADRPLSALVDAVDQLWSKRAASATGSTATVDVS